MKIAISSGKGGVGKTFIATSLAWQAAQENKLQYIDCDVEAANGYIFLPPVKTEETKLELNTVTGFDENRCTHCGKCANACYFNALAVSNKTALAFQDLCRWCNACTAICPNDAIIVGKRDIGQTFAGNHGQIEMHWAQLQTGAGGMTVRLIENIKLKIKDGITILDSPPGTSCSVVATIKDADVVVLVADPTRFGIHDLKLSVHLCRSMEIEPYVVINRVGIGSIDKLYNWCSFQQIEIIAEIPDSIEIAKYYSNGELAIKHIPELQTIFNAMNKRIVQLATNPKKSTEAVIARNQEIFYTGSELQNPIEESKNQNTLSKEITVLSGKGGTGKTSIAACFAQLSNQVVADCDVDAADMHLLLEPKVKFNDDFTGGRVMSIDQDTCISCGQCYSICEFNAVRRNKAEFNIDPVGCEGCGACKVVCPMDSIKIDATIDGRWYFSDVRFGEMSHATLEPAKENSGKLVTLVRRNASKMRSASDNQQIILDGSPGTGCPVIASVGGASCAVLVTEPTLSGLHDLERIIELTKHFNVPTGVIINKADINETVTAKIIRCIEKNGVVLLGTLPYDSNFYIAQKQGQTILEFAPDSSLANEIKNIWQKTEQLVLSGTKNE